MKQRKKHFRKRRLTPYIILAVTIVFLGTLSFIFLKDTIVIPVGSSTPNAKQAGSSQEERAVQQALAKPAPTQIQQQNGVVSVDKLILDVPYISPVSYTHLDVYKRQYICPVKRIFCTCL